MKRKYNKQLFEVMDRIANGEIIDNRWFYYLLMVAMAHNRIKIKKYRRYYL